MHKNWYNGSQASVLAVSQILQKNCLQAFVFNAVRKIILTVEGISGYFVLLHQESIYSLNTECRLGDVNADRRVYIHCLFYMPSHQCFELDTCSQKRGVMWTLLGSIKSKCATAVWIIYILDQVTVPWSSSNVLAVIVYSLCCVFSGRKTVPAAILIT